MGRIPSGDSKRSRGLLIQGTRDWSNYVVAADLTPHLAKSVGVAARVQGMRRYYALVLSPTQELCLICMLNDEQVLASTSFNWTFGETYHLALSVNGEQLIGYVNGEPLLEVTDNQIESGAIALLIEEGRLGNQQVSVSPIDA